jgi:uncharacterized protein
LNQKSISSSVALKNLASKIYSILNKNGFTEITTLWIFGSAVNRSIHKESDIDIAFLSNRPFNSIKIFNACQFLSLKLNKKIDFVDFSTAPPDLAIEILGGIRFDFSSPENADKWEVIAMNKYCELNYNRKEIVNDFLKKLERKSE